MNSLLAILFLLLALGGVVVRKTYYEIPAHELKRRAKQSDPKAKELYKAVAYGGSLRSLLWLYIGLFAALSLVILARMLPVWVSLVIVGPLLWAAFSWLPSSRITTLGVRLTLLVNPTIAWLLSHFHIFLSRGAETIEKRTTIREHTGVFERDDLIRLIEDQQQQIDSRISDEELDIARRALSFADYKVIDVLTPRKVVKTVLADEAVGPIFINELHEADQSYVLVRDKPKGKFIGTLAYHSLSLSSSGSVGDHMNKTVYYLHEQDPLPEALKAFFVTNCGVFVVVNSFEEYSGIVTVESIIKHLLGHVPGDDFDEYSNPVAVASRHKRQKQPVATTVKTDEKVVE